MGPPVYRWRAFRASNIGIDGWVIAIRRSDSRITNHDERESEKGALGQSPSFVLVDLETLQLQARAQVELHACTISQCDYNALCRAETGSNARKNKGNRAQLSTLCTALLEV